jgi:hypothetical protein
MVGRGRAVVVVVVVGVVAALYFFQSSTLAPNQTDEGLILQYIESMANGELPFYDFVDAYGLFNWVGPVAFFKAFGHRVWGVRMWMIVLKLATLLGAVMLVRGITRLPESPAGAGAPEQARGGRFYAALAGLWTAVLLGAQWQSLQTAYAFITVMPLALFTWYVVLCAPFLRSRTNVLVASVLTTIAIWTKLNTGLFLFAGGLFAYFFWIPVEQPKKREPPPLAVSRMKNARLAGAAAYALLFMFFIRKHNNVFFFLYLVVPLFLYMAWTVKKTSEDPVTLAPDDHVRPFAVYLGATTGLSLLVLFGYYGKHFLEYARELSGILSSIRYTAPFPALGKGGTYIGLNEFYWIQLPWLLTALSGVWIFLQRKHGERVYGAGWPIHRARVSSLLVFVTLHSFVMYARSDETHIFQALVLVVPVLFVVLADLDRFVLRPESRSRVPVRLLIGALALLYSLTLAVIPTAEAFQLGRGDWSNPKCDHLRYRRFSSPYTREFTESLADHDWDVVDDATAAYVKSLSLPGEEMLLLTANRLVFFNSNTKPPGGRYHFFFYLASVGLLDRKGFEKLVPREVIEDIIRRPPRIIVSAYGWVPLAVMFPELKELRDTRYEHTRRWAHIYVHELRIDGKPVPAPLR